MGRYFPRRGRRKMEGLSLCKGTETKAWQVGQLGTSECRNREGTHHGQEQVYILGRAFDDP